MITLIKRYFFYALNKLAVEKKIKEDRAIYQENPITKKTNKDRILDINLLVKAARSIA